MAGDLRQPLEEASAVLSEESTVEVGDDDALIFWMLSLTPTQRLEVAQGFAESVVALRNGDRS
jgi:hypothetical protein